MYAVRQWSVRHARLLEGIYKAVEYTLVALNPIMRLVGHERLERPVAAIEKRLKSLLFDCQMCGMCALSSTGMSCSMNCPKSLRNGPCGGVRANGNCEVKPEMRCVWVAAWEGAQAMAGGMTILDIQRPVDNTLKGTSSWLRVVREKTLPVEATGQ